MARRVSMLALAAALLSAAAGCRHCGDRCGWFSSRSNCDPPCRLVSRGSGETVIDPATGVPLGAYPAPGAVIPGGAVVPGGPPTELPYPTPSDMIPRPGLPYAPPSVAPPDPGGTVGVLPLPKSGGVPVSGGK